MLAAARGDGGAAAQFLGHAARLRDDAGVTVPTFQRDDITRACDAAVAVLGADAFAAAFARGRQAHLADLLAPAPDAAN
jgi:hypothetical protein